LLTLYEQIEPKSKNELIPKIAAGFGGGMGRCGSVCGALTASLMAVGINMVPMRQEQKNKLRHMLMHISCIGNLRCSMEQFTAEI